VGEEDAYVIVGQLMQHAVDREALYVNLVSSAISFVMTENELEPTDTGVVPISVNDLEGLSQEVMEFTIWMYENYGRLFDNNNVMTIV